MSRDQTRPHELAELAHFSKLIFPNYAPADCIKFDNVRTNGVLIFTGGSTYHEDFVLVSSDNIVRSDGWMPSNVLIFTTFNAG
jgi:hypothetical protein